MRDTCLLGKVFVQKTEQKSNLPLLYLNYCGFIVILDEEDDDDVQDNDLEEYTASIPEVPDQYNKVYNNMPTNTHMLKTCRKLQALRCKKV